MKYRLKIIYFFQNATWFFGLLFLGSDICYISIFRKLCTYPLHNSINTIFISSFSETLIYLNHSPFRNLSSFSLTNILFFIIDKQRVLQRLLKFKGKYFLQQQKRILRSYTSCFSVMEIICNLMFFKNLVVSKVSMNRLLRLKHLQIGRAHV